MSNIHYSIGYVSKCTITFNSSLVESTINHKTSARTKLMPVLKKKKWLTRKRNKMALKISVLA